MSILFISDVHLCKNNNQSQLLLNSLRESCHKYEKIFILGDLFNYWISDDISLDYYKESINTLKKISSLTNVFIMKGNRDFLIGQEFFGETQCKYITDPFLLNVNNTKIILTHGDYLCDDTITYSIYRYIVNINFIQYCFQNLPHFIRKKISKKIRRISSNKKFKFSDHYSNKSKQKIYKLCRKYNTNTLIHGHTHIPMKKSFNINGLNINLFVLGEWTDKAVSIELINNDFNCITFSL